MIFTIVNQPTRNKGDYAAFKSLVNLIKVEYPNATINCLFTTKDHDPLFNNVSEVNSIDSDLFSLWRISKICLQFPFLFKIIALLPKYNKYADVIKNSDVVVLAPGGLEIGLYQEWSVLWSLAFAHSHNVKYAIYSRSIGKFVNQTAKDREFIKYAVKYLSHSQFNGLREEKSQEFANMLGLHYYPAIDVVYSNTPNNVLKSDLIQGIKKNFVIFVPSKFSNWHPDFNDKSQEVLDNIYKKIISQIVQSGKKVVMLPHAYGRGDIDDCHYFESLMVSESKDSCIIVNDQVDTDEYQAIIKAADFAISTRLHQAIFAINNHTPVICLSYEHKMEAMMKMLDLGEFSMNLSSITDNQEKLQNLINQFIQSPTESEGKFVTAQKKAFSIATSSFKNFINCIKNGSYLK
ncbi:polysaccharide pyruvyl transferase family protein [Agarivorans sp. 1_MG-2023]|uniref:polysaccharide pyruvyl transferase family protein n=1 Tax=Agarivorans sp. 1_MG-2023 TaxID=3062634 RepID=UPI0026E3E8F2|nr:polysaccharide pyruvyl transferase family protein [Agarivorans sp. 1_MG-2023]MDO6762492.1 polysaccharide pyruvyl transferase family protein [Agarivorans sp. 1_MG-2023]